MPNPALLSIGPETLYNIGPGQVAGIKWNSQCLALKQTRYSFYRLRWRLSAKSGYEPQTCSIAADALTTVVPGFFKDLNQKQKCITRKICVVLSCILRLIHL